MGSDVVVRPAELPADAPRLYAFVRSEALTMNIRDEDAPARVDEFLMSAQVPWDLFLVADVGGALAGFLILTTGRKHSDRHVGKLRIQVGPHARGTGVGTRLMDHAAEWAAAQGVTRLEATPYINPLLEEGATCPRVSFFEKHGFEQEGILRRAARLRGGGCSDVRLMSRLLPH